VERLVRKRKESEIMIPFGKTRGTGERANRTRTNAKKKGDGNTPEGKSTGGDSKPKQRPPLSLTARVYQSQER